jgi:adenylylsulfate kinase
MARNNLYPVSSQFVQRNNKEEQLNQKAKAFWFTGLSGAGKTSIALEVERQLFNAGYITKLLDGDSIRLGLCQDLNFTKQNRLENVRRVAEVSKLFIETGIITLNCFVSPTNEIRGLAKNIIGSDFIEIYINTPLEICEQRDTKGLYAKARAGEIPNFTGIGAPFEDPIAADLIINTANQSIEESVQLTLDFIVPLIKFQQ